MRHLVAILTMLVTSSPLFAQFDKNTNSALILKSAKTALSQIDGRISLPGLQQPVEVLRDRWGVPHIYAKNADDLFFAQGFVAAQDRLFQLDIWRRVAVGETAEIFGKASLVRDRFARLLRYRGDMKAEWQSYSPDAKRIATAFTNGINACIDHLGDKLPIEFQILGYRPGKWQPEDILSRMSGISLTRNYRHEIARAELIAAVGVEKANWLMPTDPTTKFAPAPELTLDGITADVIKDLLAAQKEPAFEAPTESNNWVVSGGRSASGKPLLANDPHRTIAVPALRYLVHLHAPGWNVIGAGEPGLPGVAVGHNERVAWGFTIVGHDQSDIFVEELNPANHDEYKVDGRWEKIDILREKVAVKGELEPATLELRFTRHGPIIYQDEKRHRAFAMRWIGSEPGTAPYLGCLVLGRAGNWPEFLKAAEAWKAPTENIIYADVQGNIGWVAAALTPRKAHDGLLPVPGQTAKYDWQGFLSVKDLPQSFNPPSGYIATANHNILPPGWAKPIAFDWDPGFRFGRIKQRLDGQEKFTLEDFKSIQHDNTSLPGQILVRLLNDLQLKDADLQPYADIMRNWDGVLSREAKAGPLQTVWLEELEKSLYEKHLPKKVAAVIRQAGGVTTVLRALENADANWFGDNPQEERDELLRSTLARAVDRCKKLLGNDAQKWSWGRLHTATFHHALSKLGPGYAQAFDLGPISRPGSGLTPNNTRHDDKFAQLHGASYRELFDLSDWDKGLATSTPGQSGQPGSPHYADLLPLWAEGEYFPLAYSRKKVDEVTLHKLVLTPQ